MQKAVYITANRKGSPRKRMEGWMDRERGSWLWAEHEPAGSGEPGGGGEQSPAVLREGS